MTTTPDAYTELDAEAYLMAYEQIDQERPSLLPKIRKALADGLTPTMIGNRMFSRLHDYKLAALCESAARHLAEQAEK